MAYNDWMNQYAADHNQQFNNQAAAQNQQSLTTPANNQSQGGGYGEEPIDWNDPWSLIRRQFRDSEANRRMQMLDRDRALGTLGSFEGNNNIRSLIDAELNKDYNFGPQVDYLRTNIQSILNNPDVYSQKQLNDAKGVAQDNITRGLAQSQDQLKGSAASRGMSNAGFTQQELAQMMATAGANVAGQFSNIDLTAAQGRADNLARAQGISAQLESALGQLREGRNSQLRELRSRSNADEQSRQFGIAELLGNTQYQNPDYSGIASLLFAQQDQGSLDPYITALNEGSQQRDRQLQYLIEQLSRNLNVYAGPNGVSYNI